jgi:hypothetical protein
MRGDSMKLRFAPSPRDPDFDILVDEQGNRVDFDLRNNTNPTILVQMKPNSYIGVVVAVGRENAQQFVEKSKDRDGCLHVDLRRAQMLPGYSADVGTVVDFCG